MKKLFFALSVIFVLFNACNKDEDSNPNPTCQTGDLRLVNNSTNPYYIYLDGFYEATIGGKTTHLISGISEGAHTVKAEQKSGFLLTPTVKNGNISIFGCQTTEFFFP